MRKYPVLFLAAAIIGTVISNGCATPYPKSRGLTIKKRLVSDHLGYPTTLQIQWHGAASYSIQLGDVSILTDPFFTRHSALRVLLGTVASDPETVRNKLCKIPVAQAVFVGHSHYDHILGLASTLEYWDDPAVRVYGSKTTRNILAGFSSNRADGQWRPTDTSPGWHDVVPGIDYQAVCAEHAPNLACCGVGLLFAPGAVPKPMTKPPRKADQFKVGETYAYVFKLSNDYEDRPNCEDRTFTVYFVSAATSAPRGFPDESIETVDVAILCVPGWKNTAGYPGEFLQRLRPRVVVLSHFDNMFQEIKGLEQVVPTADLDGFMKEIKRHIDYPEFERLVVPEVDELLQFRKP